MAAAEAIRRVRQQVQWKPGKDIIHLEKRRAMGHLPPTDSLADYNCLIHAVVGTPHALVYVYHSHDSVYVGVRASIMGRPWLTIFSLAGIMETAFPPDDIEGYLAQAGFSEIGTVEELLK